MLLRWLELAPVLSPDVKKRIPCVIPSARRYHTRNFCRMTAFSNFTRSCMKFWQSCCQCKKITAKLCLHWLVSYEHSKTAYTEEVTPIAFWEAKNSFVTSFGSAATWRSSGRALPTEILQPLSDVLRVCKWRYALKVQQSLTPFKNATDFPAAIASDINNSCHWSASRSSFNTCHTVNMWQWSTSRIADGYQIMFNFLWRRHSSWS